MLGLCLPILLTKPISSSQLYLAHSGYGARVRYGNIDCFSFCYVDCRFAQTWGRNVILKLIRAATQKTRCKIIDETSRNNNRTTRLLTESAFAGLRNEPLSKSQTVVPGKLSHGMKAKVQYCIGVHACLAECRWISREKVGLTSLKLKSVSVHAGKAIQDKKWYRGRDIIFTCSLYI